LRKQSDLNYFYPFYSVKEDIAEVTMQLRGNYLRLEGSGGVHIPIILW
jgi:hypothetical protein